MNIDWQKTRDNISAFLAGRRDHDADHQTADLMLAESRDLEKDSERPSIRSFVAWTQARGLLVLAD
jgi:hypothetical protein